MNKEIINVHVVDNKKRPKKERKVDVTRELGKKSLMVAPGNIILSHKKEVIQPLSYKNRKGERNLFIKSKGYYGSLDESCERVNYNLIQPTDTQNRASNSLGIFDTNKTVPVSNNVNQEVPSIILKNNRQMTCVEYFKLLLYVVDIFFLFLLFPLCIIAVLLLSFTFFPFQVCSWILVKDKKSHTEQHGHENDDQKKRCIRFDKSVERDNLVEDDSGNSNFDHDVDEDSISERYSIDLEGIVDLKAIQEDSNLLPILDHPFVAIWPLLKHSSNIANPKPFSLLTLILISLGLVVLISFLLVFQTLYFLISFLPLYIYCNVVKCYNKLEKGNHSSTRFSHLLLWPTIQVLRAVENANAG